MLPEKEGFHTDSIEGHETQPKVQSKEKESAQESAISTQAESLIDRENFNIETTLSNLHPEQTQKLYKVLGLEETISPEQLQTKIESHLESYYQKVEEINTFLTEQIPIIKSYISEKGLIPHQNPEDIPIYITDPILNLLVDPEFTYSEDYKGEYLHSAGVIKTSEKDIIPHELFHAMSHDRTEDTVGFAVMKRNSEGNPIGNTWLDEGIVMLGEYSVYPDEGRTFHEEDYSMYTQGYLFLTELLQNELNLSTVDLQKAHFKQEPEYSQLQEKVHNRFQCTVPELSSLFIGYDEESQRDITLLMKGIPVTRTYIEGSGTDKSLKKLQKIFPSLTIKSIKPPVFED